MRVVDPGHVYELQVLDGKEPIYLHFVKREGAKFPGNVGHHAGTNLQEVLRACVDRLRYLDNQEHDDRNIRVIDRITKAVWLLEARAAERHGRPLDFSRHEALVGQTCKSCGHITCEGSCASAHKETQPAL